MGKFLSTKTYGNDRGLSCCFRQAGATHSHCSLLHGYSIGIKLIFECDELDERNWVFDFGGLKQFKKWSEDTFDHKLLVAQDDPHRDKLEQLGKDGLADVVIVPGVGCERFAEMAYKKMSDIIKDQKCSGTSLNPTVRVKSAEVFEHEANSAIYEGDSND